MIFNGVQFHLIVNHLPVVGFVVVTIALAVAMVVSSLDVKRFVLSMTFAVGLSTLPAYWTGEPAEDIAENLDGVEKSYIHEHEEAAEFATVAGVITALASAAALVWQRRRPNSLRKTLPGVFALSAFTMTTMAKTAHEGGKIRHPEIRNGAAEKIDINHD